MPDRLVADASPIIALALIGRAGLLEAVAERLVIPEAEAAEVEVAPEADPARQWLRVTSAVFEAGIEVLLAVTAWDLGAGESAVLSYTLMRPGYTAVLDDRTGRRGAEALGVRVTGTLGLLVRAKRRGVVDAVRPLLHQLRDAGFHLDDALVVAALTLAGEPS